MIYQQLFKIGLIVVLKGTLSAGEQSQRFMASPDICPDIEPVQYSTCSPELANVACDYGQFCCEGEGECVPEKTCYCDGYTFYCYDPGVSLSCPSVCPKELPLVNQACDIDHRYQCNYGDAVVCDDPGYSSDAEHQCGCYGGTFYCYSNSCPVACPVTQPTDGEACSATFINNGCDYGELCCGDDCIPDKTCYCDGSTISCYNGGGSLSCPEVCPTEPPNTNDSCEIDDRFLCQYGDAFVCEGSDYTFDFEKQCSCYNGTFYCNSFACPVACPSTPPVEGDACSPFIDFSCDYGEFCCPDNADEGLGCVADKTCYCDESTMTVSCNEPSTWCPSSCPASKPEDGAACSISDRFTCEYATGSCSAGDTQTMDASCSCKVGKFECYNYCSSSVATYDDGMYLADGVYPVEPSPEQETVAKVFVEESPSQVPSQSPSVSPTTDTKNDKGHGKKKGKKNDSKARKLDSHVIRGAVNGGNA